ncbi:MG2 domain protein [Clostridium sp. N3C]|uniref:DUF7743 domain-containing protein n=1 Tax=Clostridium sp. N3C TaxID=1776758 RepID=UPI00092DFFB9|nr:dockerin type I domain-containing protein [Clostridium sp. N3C]SCN26521.1 MG2 domain protein [Clostridium sp. N3C]
MYQITYTVNEYDESGSYTIRSISIEDRAGHFITYYNSNYYDDEPYTFDFSAADFDISGTTPDKEDPKIDSVSVNKKNAEPGDTVTIAVTASDDASGIEYLYATIVDADSLGDEWTYSLDVSWMKVSEGVYVAEYTVGQYSENGNYKIAYVELGDRVGNEITYYNSNLYPNENNLYDFSNADFSISGCTPDYEAPKLLSVNVDKKNVEPGDTVTITVQASDDVSGISYFDANVVELNSLSSETEWAKTLNIYWEKVSEGVYQAEYTVGLYDTNGTYVIDYIDMNDKAGNWITYYNAELFTDEENLFDFSPAYFTISGCINDNEVPTIDFVTVDKKNVQPGDTVTITVHASDDLSGIDDLFGFVVDENSLLSGEYSYMGLDFQWEKISEGVYQGQYTVGQFDENGIYTINYMDITDKAGNYVRYYNSNFDPYEDNTFDFSAANFSISGATPDYEAPVLTSVSVDKTIARPVDTVTITVNTSDDASGVNWCYVELLKPNGEIEYFYGSEVSDGVFEIQYTVDQYDDNGTYQIDYISIWDKVGRLNYYYNSVLYPYQYSSMDFSSANFTVEGATADHNGPELISVSIDKTSINPFEVATLTIEATDDVSGIESIWAKYRTPDGEYKEVGFTHVGNNIYKGYVSVGFYSPMTTYELVEITLTDNVYNFRWYTAEDTSHGIDLSKCNFEVYGTIVDNNDPVLLQVFAMIRNATIGDTLSFDILCMDLESGIHTPTKMEYYNNTYITFVSKTGKRVTTPITNNKGIFNSLFNVGKYTEDGIWKVYEISLADNAGNVLKVGNKDILYNDYESYDYMMDFSHLEFTVFGTLSDFAAPELLDISVDKKNINYNQISTITLDAIDDLSGIITSGKNDYIFGVSSMIFLGPNDTIKVYGIKEGNNNYYVDFYLGQNDRTGIWRPVGLILADKSGNTTNYVDSNLSQWMRERIEAFFDDKGNIVEKDFSSNSITVQKQNEDTVPPVLNNAVIDKNEVNGKDVATITLDIKDDRYINDNSSLGFVVYKNGTDEKYGEIYKENGKFIAKVNFYGFESNGLWKATYIYFRDEAGNYINYENSIGQSPYETVKYVDLNHLNITATGMYDGSGDEPNFSQVSVNTKYVDMINNSQVEITIDGVTGIPNEDDGLFVSWIIFVSPTGKYYKQAQLSYENGKFKATLAFTTDDEIGTWRIDNILILPYLAGGLKVINSANPHKDLFGKYKLMDLSTCDIEFSSPLTDLIKPELTNIEVSQKSIDLDGNVLISIDAMDDSGVSSVKVTYLTPGFHEVDYVLNKVGESFQAYISPYSTDVNIGQWKILRVEIRDNTGNVSVIGNYMNDRLYMNSINKLMDLSAGDFEVTDSLLTDVTGDNQVNILDLAMAARNYNLDESSPFWEPRADINKDKKVDIYDLVLICRRQ